MFKYLEIKGVGKGNTQKSNFFNQKVLTMLKVKNWPFTFSNPAPEASPVLTLGISSKGRVRTRSFGELQPRIYRQGGQLSISQGCLFSQLWLELEAQLSYNTLLDQARLSQSGGWVAGWLGGSEKLMIRLKLSTTGAWAKLNLAINYQHISFQDTLSPYHKQQKIVLPSLLLLLCKRLRLGF